MSLVKDYQMYAYEVDERACARVVSLEELLETGASFAFDDELGWRYYYLNITGELVKICED